MIFRDEHQHRTLRLLANRPGTVYNWLLMGLPILMCLED
jgi:hypothetical protein